jgi:hypothetical protein
VLLARLAAKVKHSWVARDQCPQPAQLVLDLAAQLIRQKRAEVTEKQPAFLAPGTRLILRDSLHKRRDSHVLEREVHSCSLHTGPLGSDLVGNRHRRCGNWHRGHRDWRSRHNVLELVRPNW